MAKIHIRQMDDQGKMSGLYVGKRCLVYGNRGTIERIGFAIRADRKARKGHANA